MAVDNKFSHQKDLALNLLSISFQELNLLTGQVF